MTRPIGDVFPFFGKELIVVEDDKNGYQNSCAICALDQKSCQKFDYITGHCARLWRDDLKHVHFEVKGGGV